MAYHNLSGELEQVFQLSGVVGSVLPPLAELIPLFVTMTLEVIFSTTLVKKKKKRIKYANMDRSQSLKAM